MTLHAPDEAAARELRAAAQAALGPVGALLPDVVPRSQLPAPWQSYLDLSQALPQHYPAGRGGVRSWLDDALREDPGTTAALADDDATALLVALCALGHTYRWDCVPPEPERSAERHLVLPAGLGRPWGELAARFDVPRVGSAWTLHLCNWRLRPPQEDRTTYAAAELSAADLTLAHQWLTGPAASDLEAFSLTFVLMEARAGAAVSAAADAVVGAVEQDHHRVTQALTAMSEAMRDAAREFVTTIRDRAVDPDRWLELVQPTMTWGLPDAEGRTLPGPNGLQLPSWQLCDLVLGVPSETPLALQARQAWAGMPREHRRLLAAADGCRDVVRTFVAKTGTAVARRRYEEALEALRRFRTAHRVRAVRYLRAGQAGTGPRASTGMGLEWRTPEDAVQGFEQMAEARVREVSKASLAQGSAAAGQARGSLELLSSQEVAHLLSLGTSRALPAGFEVLRPGEEAASLWYVLDGLLSVQTRPAEGAPIVLDTLWPGELFGEISFLTGLPVTAWVRADTDVHVVVLEERDLQQALQEQPELSGRFYRSLAAALAFRLRESAARVTDSLSSPPRRSR